MMAPLAWRPSQSAIAQNVHVQVRDAFAGVGSVIDHDTVPAGKLELFGNIARSQQQFPKECAIAVRRIGQTRNDPLWHNQNVHWRLRIDIMKRNRVFVFPNYFGRNFASNNLFENSHGRTKDSDE